MNRVAEVLTKIGNVVIWQGTDFRSIKTGDCFRLFESNDGSQVKDDQGNTQWIAKSAAYLNPKGIYEIKVED